MEIRPVAVETHDEKDKPAASVQEGTAEPQGPTALVDALNREIAERRRSEERLARINECFLRQGSNSVENINRLTALCGELLGGTCALYNRIEEGCLLSLGQWHVPADFPPQDTSEGHICLDVIRRASDEVQVLRNLASSPYARTDPNVGRYGLQTYVGKVTRCGGQAVGSLCVVYQQDFCPTDEDKRILNIVASAIAAEEERRRAQALLHESEQQLRTITDCALDAIIMMDAGGNVVFWNPAAARIFGYQAQEILGQPIHEILVPPSLRSVFEAQFLRFLRIGREDARGEVLELTARRKDGTEFPVEMALSSIQKGQTSQAVAILRDITDRKLTERHRTELLERLTGINRELKDFAYIVSHDLKAPLRAIRTLADWLRADYQDKLDAAGQENLQLLSSRVDRMQNLIDGVLQYSRIGRTEQGVVPVDLARLVPEIIENLAAPEHVSIRVENDLPIVEADATRITQVFQNLLSNAIKYLDKPQGDIVVGCVEQDEGWRFSVRDNGPGIAPKDFERIFKLFQTLRRRDDDESTGVGLTITRKIVEMYGGKIWVESEVGRGSTFFFTFPKRSAPVAAETPQTCTAG
jgi:two-component system sensor kinase FixL